MTTATIVNATIDWLLRRSARQWEIAGLVAVVGVTTAAFRHWERGVEQRAATDAVQAVYDSLNATLLTRYHRTIDTLGKRIDRDTVVVVRTVHQVRTLWDTLPEKIVTRAETVQAVAALPALRAANDSLIRACTEVVRDCAAFRLYADSAFKADSAEIRNLRRRVGSVQPSKFQTVLTWSKRAGDGCLLVSAWRHKPCWAR